MVESFMRDKGQMTMPLAIRKQFGIKPGMRLVWHVMPDGKIGIRVKNKSFLDMAGSLKSPTGKRVTIEEMRGWR